MNGGYQFDGQEITPIDTQEILEVIAKVKKDGVKNVVIVGIFSPVNPAQEKQVKHLPALILYSWLVMSFT